MKTWEKPRLIVLVRGKPEEAILIHCKAVDIAGGPGYLAGGCWWEACEAICGQPATS